MRKCFVFCIALCLSLSACTSHPTPQNSPVVAASFSADSAYSYIAEQVRFGARVPGSEAHEMCAYYLCERLRDFGAVVEIEQGSLPNYEGKSQQIFNIVARMGDVAADSTGRRTKILLCAHWDCRPWADQEDDYDKRFTPVTGANDGASGVGVLLEIARQISLMPVERRPRVDIVLFDCEDMGTPTFFTGKERENTWCLGSQLWAKRHLSEAATYKYGILLDMIGSPDATFYKEYVSMQFAPEQVNRVWNTASKLGYAAYFKNELSYPITDDHYYINTIAGIPCIDIIHYDPHSENGFAHYWHTQTDDMRNIARESLDAVGKTVLTAIQK